MRCTVRYAHLENKPYFEVGDKIIRGEKIGVMGNTGKSTGHHLHIDVVDGIVPYVWRQADCENILKPNFKQLNYFIDDELFDCKFRITTPICDFEYTKKYGITHYAYDIIPECSSHNIYWNRSTTGIILSTGWDKGYGNYVNIGFKI